MDINAKDIGRLNTTLLKLNRLYEANRDNPECNKLIESLEEQIFTIYEIKVNN